MHERNTPGWAPFWSARACQASPRRTATWSCISAAWISRAQGPLPSPLPPRPASSPRNTSSRRTSAPQGGEAPCVHPGLGGSTGVGPRALWRVREACISALDARQTAIGVCGTPLPRVQAARVQARLSETLQAWMPPAGSAEATYAASFQRMAELLLNTATCYVGGRPHRFTESSSTSPVQTIQTPSPMATRCSTSEDAGTSTARAASTAEAATRDWTSPSVKRALPGI